MGEGGQPAALRFIIVPCLACMLTKSSTYGWSMLSSKTFPAAHSTLQGKGGQGENSL